MRVCLFCLILPLLLCSCARAPVIPSTPYASAPIYPGSIGPAPRQDVYHFVGPSETLWRIGKMYDVRIEDIMRSNGLQSKDQLERGQRLLIPHAAPLRPVIALYPSTKWKYIIIHHSATDSGNANSLYDLHNRRGFTGLGYDFIIDNGTGGKQDGQIEVSGRWVKQIDGAHCKAGGMNHQGIGICLVGNFSKEMVSERQLDSLVYLVNLLRHYYHIPRGKILGHGQVPGAATECPGLRFPWDAFNAKL
jgi:N-acetylmuramoyl-L-alanine amidase